MHIENGRKLQMACVVAGVILFLVSAWVSRSDAQIPGGYLERGDYGEEPAVYELILERAEGETMDCQLEIRPRQYDADAAENIFSTLEESLPDLILGDNRSLQEVRTDLQLPKELEPYGVQAKWFSSAPEVINSFGEIVVEHCPEKGIPVRLTVELTAGEYTRVNTVEIRVLPRILTEEEVFRQEIQKLLMEAEADRPEEKEVVLPAEYRGQTIKFYHKQTKDHLWFPVLGVLAAGLFYIKEKDDAEKVKKARNQALLLGYADVIYQFMIFIGAGLTVVKAWEQIVKNYESRRVAEHCQPQPAYEEMTEAYGKMQCGTSEGKAIEEFGRRCGLQQYLKLSTLLNQNRKTGTKNLQEILEQEMAEAWEQQKNTARRMGEEAGTKLLVPLFLMLLVVMAVIMVPAMMAMG